MSFSRREFFKQSSEVAGWIALLSSMQASAQEQMEGPLAEGETDLAEFWRQSFALRRRYAAVRARLRREAKSNLSILETRIRARSMLKISVRKTCRRSKATSCSK